MTRTKTRTAVVMAMLALGTLSGCANLAPDFMRPAAPVAATWPETGGAVVGEGKALAEIGWQDFFTDARLKQLVELSLQNNRDLRVAALNVEAYRALYRSQRADLLPSVAADGSGSRNSARCASGQASA